MRSLVVSVGALIVLGAGLLCLPTVEPAGCLASEDAQYVMGGVCYQQSEYRDDVCSGGGWGKSACGGCGCVNKLLLEVGGNTSLQTMACVENQQCTTNMYLSPYGCGG